MSSFKFLEDIAWADLAFRAQGKTISDLFKNCAVAVTEAMVDPQTIDPKQEVEVKLESPNLDDLLYDFLSEIVAIKDADGLLFSQFDIKINKEKNVYELHAKLKGEEVNPDVQEVRDDVKAVTRHHFELKKVADGFEAQVILDV